MPPFDSNSVIGDVDVFNAGIGKLALTMLAARSNDAQAVGDAVLDGQAVDVHAGNAAAIQAELERGAPSPVVIVAAAADEVAVLHNRRSAEIVINVFLRIRRRKCCAEEDGATG